MEGSGSRQSRAASRYASSPSAPVFSGPVRKWKKQWVSSVSHSNTNLNKRNHTPPLLLCRWTPLSADDDTPKRRFRYTPIVPIEKGKKQSSDGMVEKPITNSKEEAQEVSEDQAD